MEEPKKEWYKPREIAKLGLIRNSTGGTNLNGNYHFILGLIHQGKLKARDYSRKGNRAFWMVHIKEIERYNNEIE